ncbi:hypothetical protein KFL_000680310 [Klebsormidium nitens]|uniref:Terpene synthase n=1 Tax=Klebsormidium nitens TaxID=105231 RepID=A0A0U9HLF8_KLENI|nr:hypothetical protein KFL_000680310 [Klebsormidium nitens]|eukprot:GAQ81014.1 hypothetical protein KFL_000680310 [Klebsormidium nitens]
MAPAALTNRAAEQSATGPLPQCSSWSLHRTSSTGPQHPAAPRRLLRIRTLADQPAPADLRGEGEQIWEEAPPAVWEEQLLYPEAWFDLFFKYIKQSREGMWGSGAGPLSCIQGELGWLNFDLGAGAQKEAAKDHGCSSWVGFMICFPETMASYKTMGELWKPFAAIDDWMEHQSPRTCASSDGLDYDRAIGAVPTCFATRPELASAASDYLLALDKYNARATQVDPAWVRRISWGSYLFYRGVMREANSLSAYQTRGTLPTLEEYLQTRLFSFGGIGMRMLTMVERSVRLNSASFARARLLLVYAGAATALFNDCLVAAKEPAEGLFNAVTIAGKSHVVRLHNVILDLFADEAARFCASAAPKDEAEEFVNVLKASVTGGAVWHNTTGRYRKYVEMTRQPFAIAGWPEGQLTDAHSRLRGEVRAMLQRIAREDLPGEFPQSDEADRRRAAGA